MNDQVFDESKSVLKRKEIQTRDKAPKADDDRYTENTRPDWSKKCRVCDATPVVPLTGMCGPCSFGEAETADGNW